MTISRGTLFQFFKYLVYAFLAMNIYWFFGEEYLAAKLLYPNGVGLLDIIGGYNATIDTAAWVVLLLMFELETYVLNDEHFTRPVAWSLHGLRVICYTFIVYAFYGYVTTLASVEAVSPMPGVTDLCQLVGQQWSYSVDFEEYTAITAANCGTFSTATEFLQFDDARAVVDAAGHVAIIGLAWIDVINAAVWLLIVVILEVDVRLQEHNLYEGWALRSSSMLKVILYSALLYAAIYWGIKGDFVDFWDAFLWLVAFVFIELNIFEWREETKEELIQDLNS